MAGAMRRGWRLAALMMMAGLALAATGAWRSGDGANGSLLVGLRDGANEGDVTAALARSGGWVEARIAPLNVLVVDTRPGARDRVAADLRGNAAVRYVDLDRADFRLTAAPNDPLYTAGKQWNIDRVQAPRAWDLLPPGGNTVVAVLDTGVDYTHPDLQGRISPYACDMFRRTCNTSLAAVHQPDVFGHGTHVAGIIAANTNNGTGVASVSGGRVTLLPIQVLSPEGENIDESIIASAIVYAVDHGAKVINMSFGGPCGEEVSQATRDAITYAESHDVLLVFAAGNSGGCREGRFPQNDDRVISVAATDVSDNGATFSDRGLCVAVAAPGVGIWSTVPRSCLSGICDPSGYAAISGTSMAAPHVAAEAALLFQVPGATKAKVVDWITSTCDSAAVSSRCGGRINVFRAVSLAVNGVDPAKAAPAPSTSQPPATTTPATSTTPAATATPTQPAQPSQPAQPAAPGRPAVPPVPTGFTMSDATRNAVVPGATSGAVAGNVSWNGNFWLTAPTITAGVCGAAGDATTAAIADAMSRFANAGTRGLGWNLIRDDTACDASFTGPKVLITRAQVSDDSAVASRVIVSDTAGTPCGAAACWVGTATIQLNPAGFDAMSPAQQTVEVLRDLARAAGLGTASACGNSLMAPVDFCGGASRTDLGPDDIASLNDLEAATLAALRPR
jgi:subtilisin family serine protease